MKVGSLFSGIGGIELGFHNAGFTTNWFVEYEPYAQAVLRKRFPNATIYGDVTKIDWRTVPKVDILTGGFPCQDISSAGKRAGITGSRSSLWRHYCQAIGVLRPSYAVIENVSALTKRGLNVVLRDLASLGYDAEWHCIPASAVGAPHRRDRIFIIAYSDSERLERKDKRNSESSNEHTVLPSTDTRRVSNWNNLPTPRFCRGGDGIPNRVDRLRCCGNAVVPQVAEVFAQAIKECDE